MTVVEDLADQKLIREYYQAVDQGDTEKALRIFSPDISYERGSRLIRGASELRRFYETDRAKTILSGRHILEPVSVDEHTVTVQGSFEGILAGNRSAIVPFIDQFEFESGLVIRRKTIFPGEEI